MFLNRIAFSPKGDAWVVGQVDGASSGVVLHSTGARFTRVPAPSGTGDLRDVVAPAADDAWAVGIDRVLHWDGRRWARSPAPAGSLWAVSASASNNVWAVGTQGLEGLLVIRWNGSAWKRVPFLPVPSKTEEWQEGTLTSFAFLEGVLALGARDVWVVGTSGGKTPLTAHWDGVGWTAYSVPGAVDSGLGSLVAEPSGRVWAAGGIRGGGLVADWNGSAWHLRGSVDVGWIPDVAVRGNEVWTVYGDAVARWNGSSWVRLEKPHPDLALMGLATDPKGNVWAAGYRLGSPKQRSAVYRYRCTGR